MFDEDAVLEHGDLRVVLDRGGVLMTVVAGTGCDAAVGAAFTHHHHAVYGLAAGQELGFGQDRRSATPRIPPVPATLAFGLESGGSGNPLDLVTDSFTTRFPLVHDCVRRIVGGRILGIGTALATTATAATTRRALTVPVRFGVGVLGVIRLSGVLGVGVVGTGVVLLGDLLVLGPFTLLARRPAGLLPGARLSRVLLILGLRVASAIARDVGVLAGVDGVGPVLVGPVLVGPILITAGLLVGVVGTLIVGALLTTTAATSAAASTTPAVAIRLGVVARILAGVVVTIGVVGAVVVGVLLLAALGVAALNVGACASGTSRGVAGALGTRFRSLRLQEQRPRGQCRNVAGDRMVVLRRRR